MVNKSRTRGACVLSVLAFGLAMSPAAHAADLAVLTALDVCDTQGIKGLTLSSSDNCLKISGEVKYSGTWGDNNIVDWAIDDLLFHRENGPTIFFGNGLKDWKSTATFKLKLEGSSASDFGAARGVVAIKGTSETAVKDLTAGTPKNVVEIDEAYLAIGDKTMLMVGKKGTIAKTVNDDSFTFQKLFHQDRAGGVGYNSNSTGTDIDHGGHVIQVTSDLGNGLTVGAALEDLNDKGTLIGVVTYKDAVIDGHITLLADEVLTGAVKDWAIHAGMTAKFDDFRIRSAVAANNDGWWNVLATADAKFDMFTLAVGAEATSADEYGVAGSVTAQLDAVKVNVGSRAFWEHDGDVTVDTAFELQFNVAEAITLTTGAGYIAQSDTPDGITYGTAKLVWKPAATFESELSGRVNSMRGRDLGYEVTYSATKKF